MPLFGRLIKTKRRHERREERQEISETTDTPVTGPMGVLPRPLPRLKKNAKMLQDKYFDTEKHKDPERSTYEKVKRKLEGYKERYGVGDERKKDLRCKPGELRCGRKRTLAGSDKPMVDAQQFGTIRDIDNREDLQLVTDSQEVDAIKAHFGNPPTLDDFQGFFVTIQDGDYGEVYAFEGSVPNLDKTLWKVDYPSSGKALGAERIWIVYKVQSRRPYTVKDMAEYEEGIIIATNKTEDPDVIEYTIKSIGPEMDRWRTMSTVKMPYDIQVVEAEHNSLGGGELAAIYTRNMSPEQIRAQIDKLVDMKKMTESEAQIIRFNDVIKGLTEDLEQMSPQDGPTFEGGALAGKHRDTPRSQFDPEQLQKGIKIEMEHTDDPKEAEEIAKDHLSELSDYYIRLEKMEAEATEHGECALCKTACETLGDPDYCKLKFKQMTDGEITKDQLDADLNKKYGDDWIDRVMNKLGG